MIEVGIFLASGTTAIETMFNSWQEMGLFNYLLPFLLIFALVFGILTKVNLFNDNKVVNAIIALVVGLIAIQFSAVSDFFAIIFPNLGIALSIILVILIIAGLFLGDVIGKEKWPNYLLLGIAGIIIVVVLVQSAGSFGWNVAQWWIDNWATITAVVLIVGLAIAAVVASSKGSGSSSSG